MKNLDQFSNNNDVEINNFTPRISPLNFFPEVAGIYLTRKCNSACSYCSVKLKRFESELTIDQWISAIDILNNLGISRLAILGGEPTLVIGLERLIKHLATRTNIEFSVVTNCLVGKEKLISLAKNGLQRISTSIDTLNSSYIDKYSTKKSIKAFNTLIQLRKIGVEHLTAYFMLNKNNINNVIEIAKILSDQGIWFYLIPYHYGDGTTHWETRDQLSNKLFAFRDSDHNLLKEISNQLKDLKHKGALIANSDSYLNAFPKYAVSLNWHCGPITAELRIDADGSLMCCHDLAGKLSPYYSVFDITDAIKYMEFMIVRSIDSSICSGCIWPSQFHALESIIYKTPLEGSLK
jgi:MoaA/NifB/PqqE/SkfB family radical SAM enzyme